MPQQEILFKLSRYEQQINHLQKQLQAIEEGLIDLSQLSLGLEELKGKNGKEILASVGRGIFVRAQLLSEELTVDVGEKTFLKKDIASTRELIGKQIDKLENIKGEVESAMEKMGEEIQKVIADAQSQEGTSHSCKCKHEDKEYGCGDRCGCESDEEHIRFAHR